MFFRTLRKTFILSIVFLGFFTFQSAYAYKSQGVQRIDPTSTMKKADKLGLTIPLQERLIKKNLLKLKRTNPKQFEKKLSQGIENPSEYQGYLMAIKEGLQKVENAKKIAKYMLYTKVKTDWDIIKTSALNTRVDKTFKTFEKKLRSDLEDMYYIKFDEGYVFQVKQWGYVTISKNLKNVMWKIEFNSKYDNNKLEEGAEDIKIQEDNSIDSSEPSESQDDVQ
jgi:hypothetical protein